MTTTHEPLSARRVRTGERARRLLAAGALNALLVLAEVIGGLAAHSTALLSDAGHNLSDVAALVLAFSATRLALRSPTRAHSFGFHRASVLSAAANVGILLAVSVAIVIAGIDRLAHPGAVDAPPVIAIAGAGLAVNVLGALVLREHRGDINVRTALVHLASDAGASLAVLASGVVILVRPGARAIDPAVSLAVAVLVALEALRIGRESMDMLLEATPADLDVVALTSAICEVRGVAAVHDLHCWSLSSDVRALSAHVVVDGHPSLQEAQAVGELVKEAVEAPFSIAHSTLELECEPCAPALGEACGIEAGQREH